MEKVWMYIDGPNFYYGLRNQSHLPIGLGWCDFRKLAENYFIDENFHLERIKYFTAPVGDLRHDAGEEQRQNIWLNAVRTIKGLQVIPGYYTKKSGSREEKQTDVNIAVHLILDAIKENGYDNAIVLSGDMDLAPAILAVQNDLPKCKSVRVCVPLFKPSERWKELSRIHDFSLQEVTGDMLKGSRLPDRISSRGAAVICPDRWKMHSG